MAERTLRVRREGLTLYASWVALLGMHESLGREVPKPDAPANKIAAYLGGVGALPDGVDQAQATTLIELIRAGGQANVPVEG